MPYESIDFALTAASTRHTCADNPLTFTVDTSRLPFDVNIYTLPISPRIVTQDFISHKASSRPRNSSTNKLCDEAASHCHIMGRLNYINVSNDEGSQ